MSDARFRILVALAVCGAASLAYVNTLSGDFVWDDASSVLLHEDIKNGRVLELFKKDQHAYGRGQGNFYRPLVSASFLVDYALSTLPGQPAVSKAGVPDVSPFLFHVGNVLWHAAAALMLFAFLARLGAPRVVQAGAPLLYVVHPLHTEAVAYISGRADSMSATFLLAGLTLALMKGSGGRRLAGAVLSAVCFALALLCKESASIFPVLLLVLIVAARISRGRENTEASLDAPYLPLGFAAVLLVGYGALRATALHFASDSTMAAPGFGARIVQTLQAFALYLRLIFVPTDLHMERTLNGVPGWVAGAGAVLLAACITLAVLALVKRQPRLWTGMAFFLITWLPISGLFPLNAPMAEHWMYLPLAGFIWALFELANLALRRPWRRPILAVATYAAFVSLLGLTVARNRDWHDNEKLYLATLRDNPDSIRVHYNLAVTYEDLVGNEPGARREFEEVLALYQKKKEAMRETSGPVPYWDDELEAHFSLGTIYLKERRIDAAARHFNELLRVKPSDSTRPLIDSAFIGLARCLFAAGQVDSLREMLEKGKSQFPELQNDIEDMLRALPAKQDGAVPATS